MKRIDSLLRILLLFALAFLSQPQSKVISQSGEETSSSIYLPFVGGVSPLQVTETSWAKYKYEPFFSIAGNLLNVSPRPIYEAVVQASVTRDGQPYGVYTGTLKLPVTFPGQYNSFYIFTNIYDTTYLVDYEVGLISWSTSSAVEYWPLTIVYSDTIYHPCIACNDYTTVNAELRNDSPRALTDVYVAVWELGLPYYGEIYYPPGTLLPGDTFTVTATLWWAEPPGIKLVGYGVAAP